MKIILCSVGKAHDELVKYGVDEFTNRIAKYYPVEWKLLPPAKQSVNNEEKLIKKQEAIVILNTISKDDFVVLLDERGKQITSVQLADFLQLRANHSTKTIYFIIGGAFGVDETVFERANYVWSFSPLVFPHQLMRLMLAEQIYRACTIIRNEKYHHQ